MLLPNTDFENTSMQFFRSIQVLHIAKILRKANIRKAYGSSAMEIFKFLLLLSFQGKNLWRFLHSKRCELAGASKNTFYRFLENPSFNWPRFLILLAYAVITVFMTLTKSTRPKVFILDDSSYGRNRSKNVELLCKFYDHVTHSFLRGFTMLALGWSDGYSFIPVGFNLLSSAKKTNRYQEIDKNLDHRTYGYKFRKASTLKKPQAALKLLSDALKSGISADYVLMDTWFTTEPFINSIKELGLDSIGMVKQLKQHYIFNGKAYTLNQLKNMVPRNLGRDCFGSLTVCTTRMHMPVKIVFIRNRNNHSECLFLLSTDISLSEEEIIRLYENRWSIETFFKASKSMLCLAKEFQCRNYGAIVAHTAIVYARYILLEWIRRNETDPKTHGELFFQMCDDIKDIDFSTALYTLMQLFIQIINQYAADNTNVIKSKLLYWMSSQPRFIKALFMNLCWES